jgi:predicted peptidase
MNSRLRGTSRNTRLTGKHGHVNIFSGTVLFSPGLKDTFMEKLQMVAPIILAILVSCANTDNDSLNNMKSPPELNRVSYMSEATGEERDYFVYLPAGYHSEPDRKWPVMMFLHGNGERGNAKDELDYAMVHGPLSEAWAQKRDLPFIIVVPQLPMYGMDEHTDYIRNRTRDIIPRRLEEGVPPRREISVPTLLMTAEQAPDILPHPPEGPVYGWFLLENDLISIMDQVVAGFSADENRVYLTGISYGGYGTWYMAGKHPERFAAIAPVVGYGHPDLTEPIARHQIPVWAFAGGRDNAVPPSHFYPALNALESYGHKNVLFTIHADLGHDAWKRIYAGHDLYDWMLEQRRE